MLINMPITTLLIVLILACAGWAVTTSMLIVNDLERRGVQIDHFWMRIKMIHYLGQYRMATQQEKGRVGPLFYHYVVSLWLVLILAASLAVSIRVGI
jgi:hypothetical protein